MKYQAPRIVATRKDGPLSLPRTSYVAELTRRSPTVFRYGRINRWSPF
jgi:hypothetical protein